MTKKNVSDKNVSGIFFFFCFFSDNPPYSHVCEGIPRNSKLIARCGETRVYSLVQRPGMFFDGTKLFLT